MHQYSPSTTARAVVVLVLVFLCLIHTCAGVAYIVQASGSKVIDGRSQDWISTAIHPIVNKQGQQIGSFRAEYDDDFLYILLSTSTGPRLGNAASFGNFPNALYSGDAGSITVGPLKGKGTNQRFVFTRVSEGNLFFVMRPEWPADSTSHSYAYYTEAHGTYHLDYLWHVEDEGANVSFSVGSSGWNAEVALPWSTIGYKASTNDLIPFDVEIIVGDPSGSIITQAGWWFSRGAATATEDIVAQAVLYPSFWGVAKLSSTNAGPQPVPVTNVDSIYVPRGVPITINIEDETKLTTVNIIHKETNFIYKELIRATRLTAGKRTIYWDGFDREEKIVPAGEYRVLVAQFPPFQSKFIGSVGNSASPPFSTADGLGSYGGQHYGPSAVAADETGVYILHAFEEGRGGLRRIDPVTGKSRWRALMGGTMATTLSAENGVVCSSSYKGNSDTGDSDFFILCFNATTGLSVRSINKMTPDSLGTQASGMAIVNSTIYLSLPGFIHIAKPNITVKTWTQRNATIPSMRCLCRFDANNLLIVFDNSLALFDINSNSISRTWSSDSRIIKAVTCTRRLDSGSVFVANNTHVLRFNANGQFSAFIGKGPRPWSEDPFDPAKLRNAQYLAVGPDKNLYVTERGSTAPYRFVVFSSTSGAWIRDYYGPIAYTTVIPDIDNPDYMYYIASKSYPALIKAKVNYTAYALDNSDSYHGFKIEAIYMLTQNGIDKSIPLELDLVRNITWGNSEIAYGGGVVFRANNGIQYLFLSQHRRGGAFFLAFDEVNKRWKPKTAVSFGAQRGWQDLDNNGLVNKTTEFFTPRFLDSTSFTYCDKDFNLYSQRYIFSPRLIDENGVPRYDGNTTRFTYLTNSPMPWSVYYGSYTPNYPIYSAPSRSEANTSYSACAFGPGNFQTFWDRVSQGRFMKVKNGKVEWVAGNKNAAASTNGDITHLNPFAGEVDGVACVDDIGSNFLCYSSDGIALGYLVGQGSYGPNVIEVENAAQASFFKDPDGRRILYTMTTGDARILEISGPFGDDAFKKSYQDITLPDPELRSFSGPGPQPKVYDLKYITQGDGRDGTFYTSLENSEGFPFEWTSKVPNVVLRDPDTGKVMGEVRMRRDAGELNVFVDVIYPTEGFFPYFPDSLSPTASIINTTMFGNAPGFEIMLGPEPNGRTTSRVGDTRIFITATSTRNGPFTGYALAIRPGAPRFSNVTFFTKLDKFGEYNNPVRRSPLFEELSIIPGAVVGVFPRYDGLGFSLEASIPLCLFPEITTLQNVTYRRFHHGIPTGSVAAYYTNLRPELISTPLSFNFAIHVTKNNITTRIPWNKDEFTGTNPKLMNPSKWGVIAQPAVAITYASVPTTETFKYYDTVSADLDFHNNKMLVVTMPVDTLVGATFFTPTVNTGYEFGFFNKSLVSGFAIENGPGQNRFQTNVPDTSMRNVPFIDITNWGIDNMPKEQTGASGTNSNHTMIVKTNFGTGAIGLLHVLWGTWSSNTFIQGYLSVKEVKTRKVINGTNYSALNFPRTYYSGFRQARDTTFIVGGKSTYEVTVTDLSNKAIYISAIWITPAPVPNYHSPATVTFVGDTLVSSPIDIENFYFYYGNTLVAQGKSGLPALWENANAGQYKIQPMGIDKYEGQSNTTMITINILGPVVSPINPSPNSIVPPPVSLSFAVSQNGPAKGTQVQVKVLGKSYNLTSAPWSIDLGEVVGSITVEVYAVDDAGDYSKFQYNFTSFIPLTSPLAARPQQENSSPSIVAISLVFFTFVLSLLL